MADAVVVSIHSHQFKDGDGHNTPDFITSFAQSCIDAGADIIVCHGPHVMRGVGTYGKGIIFWGLGDFILQLEQMSVLPEEQYWKNGLTRQECTGVGGYFDVRTKGGKIGLDAKPDAWISYVVSMDWSPQEISYTLYPIEIVQGRNGGLPHLSTDTSISGRIIELSDSTAPLNLDKERNVITGTWKI